MRVMIVAANQEHKPDPVVPLGAACVAGAARAAGHDVSLYDACFDGDRFADNLARLCDRRRPEVVGLSLRNVDDVAWPAARSFLPHYRRCVEVIRRHAPGAPLILGGSAFTLMPDAYLDALGADHGVAGEGEAAFVGLLAAIAAGSAPRLVHGTPAAAMPEPALDLLDLAAYYRHGGALNVQTRRGCGFHCVYCTYPLLEGTRTRGFDPRRCVNALARACRDAGAGHFFVVDNTFNHPVDHARAFCHELIAGGNNLRWTAYLSPAGLPPDLLPLMARAGCTSVEFGTDAADEATLRGLGKSFSVADVRAVSAGARAAGLKFAHSLILGGPGETPETLRRTVEVMDELEPDAVFAMLGVRLYPGTPLARDLETRGLVAPGAIGLEPAFYLSEAVRDDLVAFAAGVAATRPRWFVPGLTGDRYVRFWKRKRLHGARGPLWELMSEPAPALEQP
ncbi:MAG: cobalamin-dependent protein [Planctomycetes bacterium]|nr:cobalamin-dependent protein [Planctomycetota bacterium]